MVPFNLFLSWHIKLLRGIHPHVTTQNAGQEDSLSSASDGLEATWPGNYAFRQYANCLSESGDFIEP
jgi:hypothetical protein